MEEVEIILGKLKHSESIMLRTLVPVLLMSGMRINEFLALRYEDIDKDAGVIHVQHSVEETGNSRILGDTKTDSSVRYIPVPGIFFDVIDNWKMYFSKNESRVRMAKEQGNDGIIFLNSEGGIRNDCTVRDDLRRFLSKIDMYRRNTVFHGFRRTYATFMDRAGVETKIISRLLGHSDCNDDKACAVALQHYIKEDTERIEAAKKAAVEKYMVYVGDLFERNLHFTHLRRRKNR